MSAVKEPLERLKRLGHERDIAPYLSGAAGVVALAFGLVLWVSAMRVAASPTFGRAAEVAPITTWGVVFMLTGLVVLLCLARRPEALTLSLLVLALLMLAWAFLAGIASAYDGGVATAAVAYTGLSAFTSLAALAASWRQTGRP